MASTTSPNVAPTTTTATATPPTATIPVIDVGPLLSSKQPNTAVEASKVAQQIDEALRSIGFFYVRNHQVSTNLISQLWDTAREFFALPEAEKMKIDMKLGGRAWRGFFPCGGELTSGVPDHKEGLYFGADLPSDHPTVLQKLPFHGQNQYPGAVPAMKTVVREYMDKLTILGHSIMKGLALALNLKPNFFKDAMTSDPFTPFRIFNYPAPVCCSSILSLSSSSCVVLLVLNRSFDIMSNKWFGLP